MDSGKYTIDDEAINELGKVAQDISDEYRNRIVAEEQAAAELAAAATEEARLAAEEKIAAAAEEKAARKETEDPNCIGFHCHLPSNKG